jgi:hypothetical protein
MGLSLIVSTLACHWTVAKALPTGKVVTALVPPPDTRAESVYSETAGEHAATRLPPLSVRKLLPRHRIRIGLPGHMDAGPGKAVRAPSPLMADALPGQAPHMPSHPRSE